MFNDGDATPWTYFDDLGEHWPDQFAQVVLEASLHKDPPRDESPKLLQLLESYAPGNLTYGAEDPSEDEGRDQDRVFAMPWPRGVAVQIAGPSPELPVLPLRVDDELSLIHI